jgi:hypothetical protein
MKQIKCGLLLIVFLGCKNQEPEYNGFINMFHLKSNDKALIISCIKCECIIEQLYLMNKRNPALLRQYNIYADTICIQNIAYKGDNVKLVSQKMFDSVSVDFYNMLIYNPKKFGNRLRMVKTDESEQIEEMMR